MDENAIGQIVVDRSVAIHPDLRPGLLEHVYEAVFADELDKRGFDVQRQASVPIVYVGKTFDEGFRADTVINDRVILELKSVEKINNAHKKPLLTYLKLTDVKLGYLLNFGEALMRNGIVRTVNGRGE